MENLVWHYTKKDVFKEIFLPNGSKEYNEGKIRLRFTKIGYSRNDKLEGLIFKKVSQKHRKKISDRLSKEIQETTDESITENTSEYVFNASNLMDSSIFWSDGYAGTDGIAIGFDVFKIEDLEKYNLEDGCFTVRDIEYINIYDDEEKFIEHITNEIRRDANLIKAFGLKYSQKEMISDTANNLSLIYKDKFWEREKEIRIIRTKTSTTEIKSEDKDIEKYCYEYFDASIVSHIMLGPKCNDEQVKTIEEYLSNNGYKNIKVVRSRAFELRN